MQQGVQQCYVRLHGALVLRCYHKAFFKKKKKAKDFFSVSDTGGSAGKIRVLPIKSQTYDLLVTIQPDALPLSYRPSGE